MTKRTIRVEVKEIGDFKHEIWMASSDDLYGLTLMGESREMVVNDVPNSIRYLLKVNEGIDLTHEEALEAILYV